MKESVLHNPGEHGAASVGVGRRQQRKPEEEKTRQPQGSHPLCTEPSLETPRLRNWNCKLLIQRRAIALHEGGEGCVRKIKPAAHLPVDQQLRRVRGGQARVPHPPLVRPGSGRSFSSPPTWETARRAGKQTGCKKPFQLSISLKIREAFHFPGLEFSFRAWQALG